MFTKNTPHILCIFFIFSLIFGVNAFQRAHTIMPDPAEISLISSSIAISEIIGSSSGFSGFYEVLGELRKEHNLSNSINCESLEAGKCIVRNINFDTAIVVAAASSNQPFLYLEREDLGEITFHKLAYVIFGVSTLALNLLFFLILSISIFLFITAFGWSKQRLIAIIALLLSMLITVTIMPNFDASVAAVQSRRFLPVLAIIPTAHICYSLCDRLLPSLKQILILTTQIILLCFVIHVRSSCAYFLGIIAIMFMFTFAQNLRLKSKHFWANTPHKMVFAILVCVKAMFFIYVFTWSSPIYDDKKLGHLFWHPIHIGLAAHPDANKKYGIYPESDMPSFEYIAAVSERQHGSREWEKYLDYQDFDNALRDRFLHIAKTDPIFVLQSYAYKLPQYFDMLTQEVLLPNLGLMFLLVIFSVLTGIYLWPVEEKRNDKAYRTHILMCLFSFLPPLALLPSFAYSIEFTIQLIGLKFLILTNFGGVLRSRFLSRSNQ